VKLHDVKRFTDRVALRNSRAIRNLCGVSDFRIDSLTSECTLEAAGTRDVAHAPA